MKRKILEKNDDWLIPHPDLKIGSIAYYKEFFKQIEIAWHFAFIKKYRREAWSLFWTPIICVLKREPLLYIMKETKKKRRGKK